jgi:hypothetical protein
MELMHMRDRAEKRHNDWKKAIRKRRIDLDTALENSWVPDKIDDDNERHYKQMYWLNYNNLHQYSKNKIHYSYGRHRKTNNKGKHRYAPKNYAKSKNWSPSDQRKLDAMDNKI